MEKTILVTGGNGFIGRRLTALLRGRGYRVLTPGSSELNVEQWDHWAGFSETRIAHVVHLAGRTFVPDSWEHPIEFTQTNVIGTANALSFCQKKHIGMTMASAYLYGVQQCLPIAETAELKVNNPYAVSKKLAEDLCRFYAESMGVDVTILRLFNIYGPGQQTRFLIPHIVKQIYSHEEKIHVKDLSPKRDYVYIDDVCEAIMLSIEKTDGLNVFNVGSGTSYSVREMIDMLQEIARTQKRIVSENQRRVNEIDDVIADIGQIYRRWGWEPTTEISEGLGRCLAQAMAQIL